MGSDCITLHCTALHATRKYRISPYEAIYKPFYPMHQWDYVAGNELHDEVDGRTLWRENTSAYHE